MGGGGIYEITPLAPSHSSEITEVLGEKKKKKKKIKRKKKKAKEKASARWDISHPNPSYCISFAERCHFLLYISSRQSTVTRTF